MAHIEIALPELPGLVEPLRAAGYHLVTADTEAAAVSRAVRASKATVIVVAPSNADDRLRTWLRLQVSSKRRVVLVRSDEIPEGEPIKGVRTIALPATVNEVMARFGAPARKNGEVTIEANGYETGKAPEPEPYMTDELDWGAFGDDEEDAPSPSVEPEDFSTPPAPPATAAPVAGSSTLARVDTPAAPRRDDFGDMSTPPVAPVSFEPEIRPEPEPEPEAPVVTPMGFNDRPEIRPEPVTPPTPAPTPEPVHFAPKPTVMPQPPAPPMPDSETTVAPEPKLFPTIPEPHEMSDDMIIEEVEVPVHAVQQGGLDVEMLFTTTTAPGGAVAGQAPVIVVFAAKGGVGKSTMALSLAKEAVDRGLRRVVVVDMNRGQGDIRKYLRLSNDNTLPSVFDAAVSSPPKPTGAIVGPSKLNRARNPRLPSLGFGAVMAPRRGQADPAIVTAGFYARVVAEARRMADLVIVDTQIVETHDTSDLIDKVAIPLMRSAGGWGLAVSDSSMAGITNTLEQVSDFHSQGVLRDRMMFFVNRAEENSTLSSERLKQFVEANATFLGTVVADDEVFKQFELGKIPNNIPEIGQIATAVLARVTGDETKFDLSRFEAQTRKRGGFKLPWKKA